MSGLCAVCNENVKTRNKIICTDCSLSCHLNCVNMTKDELDYLTSEKQIWRCPPCTKKRRKSMQVVNDAEEGKADISQLVFMLEEAKDDRRRMEKEMNNSFEFVHKLISDQKKALDEQTVKLNEYLSIIDEIKQENVNLKKKVKELEIRLDDSDQYSRANTIEIHGVPDNQEEDVYDVVVKVSMALGVNIGRDSIDVCHRLGKRTGSSAPAGIIARMVRREDKQKIIEKRLEKKKCFTTSDIGLQPPGLPIFVNESLSPGRRKLYAAARQAKSEKEYAYLWVRHGKILMRKQSGEPVKTILSVDDIESL